MINKDRLIKTFLDLVKIDSPSGEEEMIAKELVRRLKDLGGEVGQDTYGNVIGKFPGVGEPIMLNAHMDTVEPGRGIKSKVEGNKIASDGTTILGGDAKAGIAIILEALESTKNSKRLPIEVVFTKEEERALKGAKNLDYSKIKSKHGIVFDGDEHPRSIFISSPTHLTVIIKIIGKSAHAGGEPEKGLSAIKIGGEIISLLEFGRIDFETTANIGLVKGGSAGNAVAEEMLMEGEIRSRDMKKLENHKKHFEDVVKKIAARYKDAKIELLIKESYTGFKIDEKHQTVKLVSSVLKDLLHEPLLIETGGGSDANIFYQHGIEVVILGTGVHEQHTKREYVLIDHMVDGAKIGEKLVSI